MRWTQASLRILAKCIKIFKLVLRN